MTKREQATANWKLVIRRIHELMQPFSMYEPVIGAGGQTSQEHDIHYEFAQEHICYSASGMCPIVFSRSLGSDIHVGGAPGPGWSAPEEARPTFLAEWSFRTRAVTPEVFAREFLDRFHAALVKALQKTLIAPEAAFAPLGRHILHQPEAFFRFARSRDGLWSLENANPAAYLLGLLYDLDVPQWETPDPGRRYTVPGMAETNSEFRLFGGALGTGKDDAAAVMLYHLLTNQAWWPHFAALRPLHQHGEGYVNSIGPDTPASRSQARIQVLAYLYHSAASAILTTDTDVMNITSGQVETSSTEGRDDA